MSIDDRISVRLRAIAQRAERTTRVPTGRLASAISPAMARGIAASILPGGRELLDREVEMENVRNLAEALGLPRSRADELVAEANAHAITLPYAVSWADICRAAARRLGEVVLPIATLRDSGVSAAEAFGNIDEVLDGLDSDADQIAYDSSPDDCWRCDAKPADGRLGLCTPCRTDLAS